MINITAIIGHNTYDVTDCHMLKSELYGSPELFYFIIKKMSPLDTNFYSLIIAVEILTQF